MYGMVEVKNCAFCNNFGYAWRTAKTGF